MAMSKVLDDLESNLKFHLKENYFILVKQLEGSLRSLIDMTNSHASKVQELTELEVRKIKEEITREGINDEDEDEDDDDEGGSETEDEVLVDEVKTSASNAKMRKPTETPFTQPKDPNQILAMYRRKFSIKKEQPNLDTDSTTERALDKTPIAEDEEEDEDRRQEDAQSTNSMLNDMDDSNHGDYEPSPVTHISPKQEPTNEPDEMDEGFLSEEEDNREKDHFESRESDSENDAENDPNESENNDEENKEDTENGFEETERDLEPQGTDNEDHEGGIEEHRDTSPASKRQIGPQGVIVRFRNIVTKLPGGKWRCNTCKKIFLDRNKLRQHLMSVHDNQKEMFECKLCAHNGAERVARNKHKIRMHLYKRHQLTGNNLLNLYGIPVNTEEEEPQSET